VGFYKRLYSLVARSGLPSPPEGQSLQQSGSVAAMAARCCCGRS